MFFFTISQFQNGGESRWFTCKKRLEREEAGVKEEGGGDEGKICDSISHNVQYNAKYQMIS